MATGGLTAYYNDSDRFVAEWLRRLIAGGHLPPGDVDERSIIEVRADDLKAYTQCHFFAGIGGWPYALRLAGWPDERPVWTGSAPCQPFSSAGKGGGHADERHLWPAWLDLIRERRPQRIYGEQVSRAAGIGWLDAVRADLETEGYAVGAVVLGAHSVGAPHRRHRLYFVAHPASDDGRARVGGTETGTRTHGERGRRSAGGGAARPVDDAERGGLQGPLGAEREGAAAGQSAAPRGSSAARPVADARRGRSQRQRPKLGSASSSPAGAPRQRQRVRPDGGDGVESRPVADADGGEPGDRGVQRGGEHRLVAQDGRAGPVADGDSRRRERERLTQHAGEQGAPGGQSLGCREDGDLDGPWADVRWLVCRDGKARPVVPEFYPLADGIPGRVGQLRAYGNAIVPQVAAAFIEVAEAMILRGGTA